MESENPDLLLCILKTLESESIFYMKRKGMTSFTGVNGVEIRETGDPVYQVPVPDMEKEFGNII